MMKLVIFMCLIALFIQAFAMNKNTYRRAEYEKVSACYKSWKYEDSVKIQTIPNPDFFEKTPN